MGFGKLEIKTNGVKNENGFIRICLQYTSLHGNEYIFAWNENEHLIILETLSRFAENEELDLTFYEAINLGCVIGIQVGSKLVEEK